MGKYYKYSVKCLKSYKWTYCFNYQYKKLDKDKIREDFWKETMKILFSSHLLKKSKDKYNNLDIEEKYSLPILIQYF